MLVAKSPTLAAGPTLEYPGFAAEATATVAHRRAWLPAGSRDAVYRRALAFADAVAATGAVLLIPIAGDGHVSLAMLCAIPLIVIMSHAIGTYSREDLLIRKSTLDEAPALFQLATFYALAAWLLYGFVTSGGRGARQLAVLWIGTFGLLLLFRAAARAIARVATAPERCLVIGDQRTCEWMQLKLIRRRSLHAAVVARIVPGRNERVHHSVAEDVGVGDLEELADRFGIDRIIITPGRADDDGVVNIVHAATSLGLKVSVLPKVLQVIGSSSEFDAVEGVPLLSVRPLRLRRSARITKRTMDIVGSTLGLVILAPLFTAIAIAIKLDGKGRVLFRQSRVGRDGQDLRMLKFRTMVEGADTQKATLHHLNEADGLFKITDDPRITRVGKWLRRTSLDELPQLFNVLRGEMSLVGPRPLVADEDIRLEGWSRRRLRLTPGMTGHWQILGSARIPLQEMAQIDYLYVSSWSLWLDIKILLRTIPYVLSGKGL